MGPIHYQGGKLSNSYLEGERGKGKLYIRLLLLWLVVLLLRYIFMFVLVRGSIEHVKLEFSSSSSS